MISITGSDYQSHELRCVSIGFKEALRLWQKDAPNDLLFCAKHGVMEPISLYDPDSIAYMSDRVEREKSLCGAMEAEERERISRDMEAGRTRRLCGNSHR